MADFRKLAIDLIAADGTVSESELKILKKAVYEDGKVRHDEVLFLAEVRAAVLKKAKGNPTPEFDAFFLKAVQDSVLDNGIISAEEVEIVKKHVIGDKKLEAGSVKKFMDTLKKKATTIDPGFDKLHETATKKAAAAAPAAS